MSVLAVRHDVSTVPHQGGYVAKRCPVWAQNNVLLADAERMPASEAARRRMDRGIAFEADVFARLATAPGAVLVDRGLLRPEREAATVAAMAARAPIIVGGRLPVDDTGRRVGEPDVLVAHADGYLPVDVKHHRTLDDGDGGGAVVSELDRPRYGDAVRSETTAVRLRKDDLLQLAHYHRMLEAAGQAAHPVGGIVGVEGCVVWHHLDDAVLRTRSTSDPKKKTKYRSPLEVYDFEFGFRLDICAVAALHLDDPSVDLLVVPAKNGECGDCDWWNHCGPILHAPPGDLTLLPRLTWDQRRVHVACGVTNLAELAALDPFTAALTSGGVDCRKLLDAVADAADDTPVDTLLGRARKQTALLKAADVLTAADAGRIDPDTAAYPASFSSLAEHVDLARARLGPAPVYRRRGVDRVEVPRADVEVDIDMENAEDGVYLWGAYVTDRTGTGVVDGGYRSFTNWEPWTLEGEQGLLAKFWTWLSDVRRMVQEAGLAFRAYCYNASAENQRLRNAAAGTDLEADVAAFTASDEWVDLLRVVERQVITGDSLGLKAVAPLAGFHWSVDDAGGDQSMVRYDAAALGDGDAASAAREWLLSYNADDCRATFAIRDWFARDGDALPSVAETVPGEW